MSRLGNYQNTLEQWGLAEIPFRSTPPENPEEVAKIFHGREEDLERAIPALYEGRNILIRGAWGIGKTALIVNLIYELQKEVAALNKEMAVLYLSNIPGDQPTDFYRALLLALTKCLSDQDKEAQDLAETLMGYLIPRSKLSIEGKVNLWAVSFGVKSETPTDQRTPTATADPYPLLMDFLNKAEEKFGRIVIAIDDFDKKEPIVVQSILEGSLDLFRQGKRRAFIVTGRGFTDVQEATVRALGIFTEDIALQPMSADDLRQIVIKYLNSVRKEPRSDVAPFTDSVLDRIIDYAQGFPRQLNTICEKVLLRAASAGVVTIDEDSFSPLWQKIQQEFTQALTPQLRHLLYIAYQTGGITENIEDEHLEKLNAYTFVSLLPQLKQYEEQGHLIRLSDEEGFRFIPTKMYSPD